MKNQYTCDIGDFTKIGLLRQLQKVGLSVGLNWYLTPDDGRTDGKFITYLQGQDDGPDPDIFKVFRQLIDQDHRTVFALEESGLMGDARFINEMLDFTHIPDKIGRQQHRESWHRRAVDKLQKCNVVFLDPDNGLEIASVRPWGKNGNKFTTYAEVADYYLAGSSVIVYNHRDRSPAELYLERILKFRNMDATKNATVGILRAFRTSVRDYFFVSQPAHAPQIREVIDSMMQSAWTEYMREIDLP